MASQIDPFNHRVPLSLPIAALKSASPTAVCVSRVKSYLAALSLRTCGVNKKRTHPISAPNYFRPVVTLSLSMVPTPRVVVKGALEILSSTVVSSGHSQQTPDTLKRIA